ncbi:MAG: tryptophan synthase alpha chain [Fimbriimonadaceae bacterium]|jgi:tryptophan synthase alpha chain|nr:tryptophan synthase alpha chain [Fimbriimonadaceae bacterium]
MTIGEKFEQLRARGERALVLFVTAGDPSLEQLPDILSALQEGGADLIEVGIPFSDPIADGPTIQASSQRALDGGTTPGSVLAALSSIRLEVPVVTMGYYNTLLRLGLEQSARTLAAAGVNGTIVSDLTPEESGPWVEASKDARLDTIFLAAPTSTDERIGEVCRRSTGFLYAVSRTGVTGASQSVPPEVAGLVSRIKACTDLPVCVGFGISTPTHVRMVCEVADGAVIGSWLVDFIHEKWSGGSGRDELVSAIRELKAATRP